MRRFEDRVVLLTGAASGIGRASALRVAQEGAKVFCVDLQADALEETVKSASELGSDAAANVCDVSDQESVKAAVAAAIDRFGRVDSLCNIAGILHADNTHELELSKWRRVLDVNLTGTFLMCQNALPHLLASAGNIVNVSSTAALSGHPWMAAYAASKGGVLALTHTLAIEYGQQGVRANAICPGSIETPMSNDFQLPEGANPKLLRRLMPLDTFRGPETAASVVAFLASDDAAHVNGEFVRCDGATLS